MERRLSRQALEILARVPDDPVPAQAIPHSASLPGVRHLLRRLIDSGLVEATGRRPLTVRAANNDVVLALQSSLRRNPKNATLLSGATLPVLAVLSAYSDTGGADVERISHDADIHVNTGRTSLQRLRDRGLITTPKQGYYSLAVHAFNERLLGDAYAKHCLRLGTPHGARNVIDISPLVRIVEADDDLGLPLTAVSRFQAAGADVVARRYQVRVHAFRDDDMVSLQTALEDARHLKTALKTIRTMEAFMDG